MRDYLKVIDFINETKSKFLNNRYVNVDEAINDYFKTISLVWEEIDNVNEQDLTNMYKVHEFLINEVCNIHDRENSNINEEVFKQNINIKIASAKLEDGKRGCNMYSFNDMDYEYYLIGDIHSDTISLRRILEKTDFFNKVLRKEKVRLIFLGDYVDRGKEHLKTLQCLLTLKYIFTENIFLQRGNHDGGSFVDGQVKMWVRKPEKDLEKDWFLLYLYNLANSNKTFNIDIIDKYLGLFDSLSNVSFICNENIALMAVHGGIPRPRKGEGKFFSYINSISDLTNENILDYLNGSIIKNMMWSDPSVSNENLKEDNARFRFTEEHFKEFRDLIGFDIFVRGHQAEPKGYHKFFDDRLITIFSSGAILNNEENINNETAYGNVEPKILNINKKGEVLILDLNS
ncbi:metallophosphoesterase family protein [Tissierella praeacuta]|uniref:metallophosphoesterase family protein n=1 Tax=Tissierella praeacuta TaxID=43131 RepID=UPI003340A8DE